MASGLTPPAGWQALPEIATAVGAAARAEGVTVDGAEAWGEPAMGCYAAWVSLHGDGATSQQVMKGLEEAKGNYKIVTKLFNMEPGDYKRFLNFLRKHDCQLPFRDYR